MTHISVTACFNTLARSIYDIRNVWGVSVYIVASEVPSNKNKPKGEKKTRRKTYSAKKSGSSNSGHAGPATTALATFPTGGHKAARHIQGNMSKTNTNKEIPRWNGQLESYWREKLVSQA